MEKIGKSYRYGALAVLLLFLSGCHAVTREPDVSLHPHGGTGIGTGAGDRAGVAASVSSPTENTTVLDLRAFMDLDHLLDSLADRQVVFVGETHDRYEHHLNQLTIIRGLYARHPDLVIGMEFFQQPFQTFLDQFIAGKVNEKEFLKKTEYFARWRYDYRLYRPILAFARSNGIPVIALNLPAEITGKVAQQGLASLSPAERAQIPTQIDRSDKVYEQRIRLVYAQHPHSNNRDFAKFLDVQLLWDEGMAERVAAYFRDHPDGHMVVLAGSGHLMYGAGIPKRVQRRVSVDTAIVLNGMNSQLKPGIADYLLLPERKQLPRPGLLGIRLDNDEVGVRVTGFSNNSPAEQAGLKEGDRIVRIGDAPISSYPDIRLALLGQKPGQKVRVEVERKRILLSDQHLSYDVTLY